jgi:hypothetical protein
MDPWRTSGSSPLKTPKHRTQSFSLVPREELAGADYERVAWDDLDTWLDLIAQRQPTVVMYTFGLVPCWISTAGCDGKGWGSGHNYSPSPPSDLTSSGSPSFNSFVEALVQHCSPAGHCVKDYIKYCEM